MHLILTGATGLVGSAVLSHMLSLPAGQIDRISILTRRPVPMADGHPHVNVITHGDFNSYPPELLEQLKGAEGCVWAVGVSVSMVSREGPTDGSGHREYINITVDYPVAAAKAFSTLSDSFKFVYVSSKSRFPLLLMSAISLRVTDKPGVFSPSFVPMKAQAESSLLALPSTYPSLRPFVLRPGYVDASPQPTLSSFVAQRPEPFIKKLIPVLGPIFRTLYPARTAPTPELGRVLCELAMGNGEPVEGDDIEGEGRIVGNPAMRRMAGL
ncbi:hypothetical protein FGG08_005837 [Glutinoglossum americanum]|uniref:Nucleoside-diphosphate-sugar epimerase n=1 Tax=Glutinoglossum americanum TaxID=1670608 RepID=A0A9P8I8M4_9PEZI|nr:hypothetical protein FGG08_005837 [Glutinoglossum americanum]